MMGTKVKMAVALVLMLVVYCRLAFTETNNHVASHATVHPKEQLEQQKDNHNATTAQNMIARNTNHYVSQQEATGYTNDQNSNHEERQRNHYKANYYCIWSPTDQEDCRKIITNNIRQNSSFPTRIPLRWFFFGDSTVAQLWQTSSLHQVLVHQSLDTFQQACPTITITTTTTTELQCQEKQISQQCPLNHAFGLPLPESWTLPNRSLGEGPLMTVATTNNNYSGCLGCKNCQSNFVVCQQQQQGTIFTNESTVSSSSTQQQDCWTKVPPQRLLHGGYFAMPFARDVILQTPPYTTSQQSILLEYFARHINNHDNDELWGGRPICVARAGLHDMALPAISRQQYVANVQWYLSLLLSQCTHVIWLQNTAPLQQVNDNDDHDDDEGDNQVGRRRALYRQTIQRVRAYDLAVYQSLESLFVVSNNNNNNNKSITDYDNDTAQQQLLSVDLLKRITTMDVFEASKDWPHADNIHLTEDWNRALGMFFLKVATKLASK